MTYVHGNICKETHRDTYRHALQSGPSLIIFPRLNIQSFSVKLDRCVKSCKSCAACKPLRAAISQSTPTLSGMQGYLILGGKCPAGVQFTSLTYEIRIHKLFDTLFFSKQGCKDGRVTKVALALVSCDVYG